MFVCLSSGASPRYRQDILRALAIPRGARLQFRYDSKWIAQTVREQIPQGKFKQPAALIAYVDQHDKARIPELVPCRFATIAQAEAHGTTASLVLSVDDFAYSEDLAAFNTELQSISAGTLPKWQPSGEIEGAYWLELSAVPVTAVRSSRLADWERIINQIGEHDEFKSEKYFYTLQGIRQVGSSEDVLAVAGISPLKSGKNYECRIYHFHPKTTTVGTGLRLTCPNASLVTFTTNTFLSIDSRYDLKRVRFKTGRPAHVEESIISVHHVENGQSGFGVWDFDLPLKISGTFVPTLGYGVALGALLAAPQTVAALSNPSLSATNQTVIVLVAWISGLLAGVLAAFGIRRSI